MADYKDNFITKIKNDLSTGWSVTIKSGGRDWEDYQENKGREDITLASGSDWPVSGTDSIQIPVCNQDLHCTNGYWITFEMTKDGTTHTLHICAQSNEESFSPDDFDPRNLTQAVSNCYLTLNQTWSQRTEITTTTSRVKSKSAGNGQAKGDFHINFFLDDNNVPGVWIVGDVITGEPMKG